MRGTFINSFLDFFGGLMWKSHFKNSETSDSWSGLSAPCFWSLSLKKKGGNPLAQGSYSIYVPFANDTGNAGQIHKRRSTLENPANPWLKVHVLASMDKLWQIFPGKRSKEKKKQQQNWDPFWLKSGLSVSGRKAKFKSACQMQPFRLKAIMGSPLLPRRKTLCHCPRKGSALDDCFIGQSGLMLS